MKARLVENEHVTWAATAIQICEMWEICFEFHIVIQLCMHNEPAKALRCLLWPILGKWNCFWFLATCLTKSVWRRKLKLFALLHTPVLSVCPPDFLFFFFFADWAHPRSDCLAISLCHRFYMGFFARSRRNLSLLDSLHLLTPATT